MQTERLPWLQTPPHLACVIGLGLWWIVGCGTNKFEQEVVIEESAVKLAKEVASGRYEVLTTEEMKVLIDDKTPMVLLDSMPAASSYDVSHLPGAVNFEFPKETMSRWDEETMPGRTKEQYASLLGENLDSLVVVYCGFVKCARSHNAALYAQELGYTNVRRYAGGIYAWRGSHLPVESK
jgi:rhodanese-related sulfurtransferase